jgi:hypothetical protein
MLLEQVSFCRPGCNCMVSIELYFGKFVNYYFLYLFCVSKVPIIYAVICLEVSSV